MLSANLIDVGVWGKREGSNWCKAIEISFQVGNKIIEDIVSVPWGTIILLLLGFYCFYKYKCLMGFGKEKEMCLTIRIREICPYK